MNYSTNYNLNKPERSEQFNLDHWNNNTDTIDTQMHINKVNIAQNATDIATLFTGLNTKNTSDTNSVFYKLMKLIYPVGSLYWSANSTNPSTLFGGTWVQIKDRFVLACGDTYKTVGATGGASSVTLSVSNMPSHTHTFTGSEVTSGGNNRGHTHSVTASGDVSVITNPTFTGTPVTSGAMSNHSSIDFAVKNASNSMRAPMISFNSSNLSSLNYIEMEPLDYFYCEDRTTNLKKGDRLIKTSGKSSLGISGSYYGFYSGTLTLAHTHSVTASGSISGGKYKFTGSAVTSGAESQNHTHTVTASGTNDKTGGGQAHENMPPYVVKYCWERTA